MFKGPYICERRKKILTTIIDSQIRDAYYNLYINN